MSYINEKENIIKGLQSKYVPDYDYGVSLRNARNLVSDMRYICEHFQRTKRSARFDILPIPTINNSSEGRFIKKVFDHILYYKDMDSKDFEDVVQGALDIIELTNKIINAVYNTAWRDKTPDTEIVKDFISLEGVVEWYYEINLSECLGDFIGCSQGIEATRKFIENFKKANN